MSWWQLIATIVTVHVLVLYMLVNSWWVHPSVTQLCRQFLFSTVSNSFQLFGWVVSTCNQLLRCVSQHQLSAAQKSYKHLLLVAHGSCKHLLLLVRCIIQHQVSAAYWCPRGRLSTCQRLSVPGLVGLEGNNPMLRWRHCWGISANDPRGNFQTIYTKELKRGWQAA